MNTVLIIGAGGVGHVVANKCAQLPDIFQNIHLASRTKSKCDAIAEDVRARTGISITTHAVNADDLDTANYEPRDVAKFEYSWQWAYQDKFRKAGLFALLGSGFDPGVTNVFTAWALKHHFDEIHTLDIIDVNGGDHGKAFATNFNPEINIREVTQKAWSSTSRPSAGRNSGCPSPRTTSSTWKCCRTWA